MRRAVRHAAHNFESPRGAILRKASMKDVGAKFEKAGHSTGAYILSDAVALYLKRYPGKSDDEFTAEYGPASESVLAQVKAILQEAIQIEPDWNRLSLNEAGDYVESVMHERHPDLSAKALDAIGNYYTFLMR